MYLETHVINKLKLNEYEDIIILLNLFIYGYIGVKYCDVFIQLGKT